MSKQQNLVFTGIVLQELGNSMFKVELDDIDCPAIICTISGKIRKNYIRILAGDKVRLEMSPYDLTKGRIVTRLRNEETVIDNNNKKLKQ
jgi:translation initiation factor IF-1